MADKDSLDVILATKNRGQRYIYGGITKVRYGYFAMGDFIPGVAKADIRSRPDWFVCPNCRHGFTIASHDVYCRECTKVVELTTINTRDLAKSVAAVRASVAPPPPPAKLKFEEAIAQIFPDEHSYLAEIDFGRTVNKYHKSLLVDEGIVTLYDVRDKGYDGLISITGIGKSVATALMEAAELEIS